jgi:uncharacterized membrane protein YdbT with pleckstrin-like domain
MPPSRHQGDGTGSGPAPATAAGFSEAKPDAASPAQPSATLLPAELLQPGEIIILLLKPSLLYIVLSSLRTLAIIGLVTMAMLYLSAYPIMPLTSRDILLLGFGVAGVKLFWQFLEWLSRVYVLTDRRIIRVKGVLRVEVFESLLKNIQHTECLFMLRERLFGLGTLGFSTAGTGLPEAYWQMVSRPLEVHQTVVQAIGRYR